MGEPIIHWNLVPIVAACAFALVVFVAWLDIDCDGDEYD